MEKRKLTLEQSQKIINEKRQSLGITKKSANENKKNESQSVSPWIKKGIEEFDKKAEQEKKYREAHPEIKESDIYPCKKYEIPEGLIPPKYAMEKLILENKEVINWCEKYPEWVNGYTKIKAPRFVGNTGTGKTYQMYAIIRQIYNVVNKINEQKYKDKDQHYLKEPNIEAITCADLIEQIQKGIETNTSSNILEYYETVNILMIDDLARLKITEFNQNKIWVILNTRINYCRQTVITSNFSLGEISENIGDAVASRLCELTFPVEMIKNDRRMQ